MSLLYVYAAPREAGPWVDDPRTLALGVGKVAAAVALTRRALERRPDGIIVFGVAGAYPGGPAVGEACLVTTDRLADEGVQAPDGFLSLGALGLGSDAPFEADAALTRALEARVGPGLPRVAAATVSTCSGTDERQDTLLARHPGVAAETMEGAAVAAVCAALAIPWAQLRVISNRTGDREAAGWDLEAALAALHGLLSRLLGVPRSG